MRRIACSGWMLAACLVAGCGTGHQYRNIGAGRSEPIIDSGLTRVSGSISDEDGSLADDRARPGTRKAFARENVPDSVMLRNNADQNYRDEVVLD